jgi:ADP-ribose pyrophosphatase
MRSSRAQRLASYQALREARVSALEGAADGLRIATDPGEIADIEEEVAARYASQGWLPEWAEVGVAYQDPFLRLLRDAVVFPDGRRAVHHRILSNTHPSGAAVLPVHGKRVVLIHHFRHPSRCWHWEIPRGAIEPGQTAEVAAKSELEEEIGSRCESLVPLGLVHGASSLVSGAVALFLGHVDAIGAPQLSEAIAAVRTVEVAELESMIDCGEITDAYTLGAVLRARLKGLL